MKVVAVLTFSLVALVQCRRIDRATHEKGLAAEESERIKVCIDDALGCFPETEPGHEKTYGESWDDFWELQYFMSPRDKVNTEFHYWAPKERQATVITNANFHVHIRKKSGFDPNLKTFFIIHGFRDNGGKWMVDMKDALMKNETSNIFLVNWWYGILYGTGRANTWVVGAELGRLVQRLEETTGMKPDKVHIIGHNLGAHAAGYAGKWIQDRMGGRKVKRITGLDPVGLDFDQVNANERLDRKDAEFVDIIHSNAAEKLEDGFGLLKPIGHFDFYPNGGEQQPGCPNPYESMKEFASETLEYFNPVAGFYNEATGDENNVGDAYSNITCSHYFSILLFIDSIEHPECPFKAKECKSWTNFIDGECDNALKVSMGYQAPLFKSSVDPKASKKFILKTDAKAPFCRDLRFPE